MSGEALMGDGVTAISPAVLNRIAKEIKDLVHARKLHFQVLKDDSKRADQENADQVDTAVDQEILNLIKLGIIEKAGAGYEFTAFVHGKIGKQIDKLNRYIRRNGENEDAWGDEDDDDDDDVGGDDKYGNFKDEH